MWALRRDDELSGEVSPRQWLDRILSAGSPGPGSPEAELHERFSSCQALLQDGSYDVDASLFVVVTDQPAGLVVTTTSTEGSRLELVAVRRDLRRQGLGRALLAEAVSTLRSKGKQTLRTGTVSSRMPAAVGFLTALGFVAGGVGSLRMWRRLNGDLPRCQVPPGYKVRALRPGEEAAWVALKNDCFPESTPWTLEQFHKELSSAACFDFDRMLVGTCNDRLAGMTIAWEANYGEPAVGLIHWVGVHPSDRGVGLGKTLNTMALAQLSARGYAEVWLNTSRDRAAAVGLYESLGFEIYRELDKFELHL